MSDELKSQRSTPGSGLQAVLITPAATRDRWLGALRDAGGPHRFLVPEEVTDAGVIDAAVVANPPPRALEGYPRLRLVQSLWMGVEGLLADATLPAGVPVARMVDPGMTRVMPETVLTHVLWAHRHMDEYARAQAAGEWRPLPVVDAADRRVAVLGLGELGARAALTLARHGFHVLGWSRTARVLPGVACHAGPGALARVVEQADILVNLLPLTPGTRGVLNAERLAALPRGAVVVNLARAAHLPIPDLLDALDTGHVRHAILDVFDEEPLPGASALWRHPRITITPHVAAPSDPRTCVPVVLQNLDRVRDGLVPLHLVDRTAGY